MEAELRAHIMSFRITELQALLAFAGKSKYGRKNELQTRCLQLLKSKSPQVFAKIRELHRVMNYQMANNAYSHYGNSYSTTETETVNNIATASHHRYDSVQGQQGYYSTSTSYMNGQGNAYSHSLDYQHLMTPNGHQNQNIPMCPDIKIRELPFFETHSVLIRPTTLLATKPQYGVQSKAEMQTVHQSFCLSPAQVSDIGNSRQYNATDGTIYGCQAQLRFCALDMSEEQDDMFPPSIAVKVNGRPVQLPNLIPSNRPGVEAKRPSKPVDISNYLKLSAATTNIISVSWVSDIKRFVMTVNVVTKLTASDLFQRLKNKRIQPADFTRGRIKEITSSEEDDLCAPTSIKVSVACPLGKTRMQYPCRSTACKHLQCFDANSFLMMNEKKPTFICPVCNKRLKFSELCIDGYFMSVIKNLSINDGNEIELFPDGHWEKAVKVKNEIEDVGPAPKRFKTATDNSTSSGNGNSSSSNTNGMNLTINLDDDDICIVEDEPEASTSGSKSNAPEIEVVDLIDSSDEEDFAAVFSNSGQGGAVSEAETLAMTPTSVPLPEVDIASIPSTSSVTPTPTPVNTQDKYEEEDGELSSSSSDVVLTRRTLRERGKKRINYIEDSSESSDSSSDDEDKVPVRTKSKSKRISKTKTKPTPSTSSNSHRRRDKTPSPEVFDVSDSESSSASSESSGSRTRSPSPDDRSPSPIPRRRQTAFRTVSASSSVSSAASSSRQSQQQGSGSGSSASAATLPMPNPLEVASRGSRSDSVFPSSSTSSLQMLRQPGHNSFQTSQVSQSTSIFSTIDPLAYSSMASSSRARPATATSTAPDYYDARGGWDWEDINSLINSHEPMGYGRMSLSPFDLMDSANPYLHFGSSRPPSGSGGAGGYPG